MTPLLPSSAPLSPPACSSTGSWWRSTKPGGRTSICSRRGCCIADPAIVVTLFVFDVLAVEGLPTTMQPYSARRALLEQLELETERLRLVATFEDGEALFAAVCERDLEGVVAKRDRNPYRPGHRVWVKTKNSMTARFAEEREGARRRARSTAR